MVDPKLVLLLLALGGCVWVGDKVVDGAKKAGHAIVHVLKKAVH